MSTRSCDRCDRESPCCKCVCASCGESGRHWPSCCYIVPDALTGIRADLTSLLGRAMQWATTADSYWKSQLIDRIRMAIQDCDWAAGDIEARRIDAEKRKRGE